MSIEDNKAVVRRLYEVINAQDGDTLDEVLSPELAQEFKQNVLPWLYSTFAGHQATITDLLAEGDKVVARLATQGGIVVNGIELHQPRKSGLRILNFMEQ